MARADGARTSHIGRTNPYSVVPKAIDLRATSAPRVIGDQLLVRNGDAVVCYDLEHLYGGAKDPAWTATLPDSTGTQAVIVRSFAYYWSGSRTVRVDLDSGRVEELPGTSGAIAPRVEPLAFMVGDGAKIVFLGARFTRVYSVDRYNKIRHHEIAIPSQIAPASDPLEWNGRVVFLANSGRVVEVDLEAGQVIDHAAPIADAEMFSSPCRLGDTLYCECMTEDGVFLTPYNLMTQRSAGSIRVDGYAVNRSEIRFMASPVAIPQLGVVVASISTANMLVFSADLTRQPPVHAPGFRHWFALSVGNALLYLHHDQGLMKAEQSDGTVELTVMAAGRGWVPAGPPAANRQWVVFPLEDGMLIGKVEDVDR